jgi:kynurenine formamidase
MEGTATLTSLSGSLAWTPPSYEVDDQGKVVGYVNSRTPNNWGRWGENDELGTTNLITAEIRAAAAQLIRTGQTISCSLPLGVGGPVHPSRTPIGHFFRYSGADMIVGSKLARESNGYQGSDDYLIMPVQGSTQWDGLAHVGFDDCMYNGFWIGNVDGQTGARRLSIAELKDTLIGRGVLLDVPRHLGVERLQPGFAITADLLDQCAERQGVSLESGDMVLIRTGHLPWFYTLRNKREFWGSGAPGLAHDCAEWAHSHDVAAIAVDNVGVEVEPFSIKDQVYPLHIRLIRDLGMVLGEMWWMEELADACAASQRYAFYLTAPPLAIAHGAGSMVNPVAVL